jgi:hypothetical protein
MTELNNLEDEKPTLSDTEQFELARKLSHDIRTKIEELNVLLAESDSVNLMTNFSIEGNRKPRTQIKIISMFYNKDM